MALDHHRAGRGHDAEFGHTPGNLLSALDGEAPALSEGRS